MAREAHWQALVAAAILEEQIERLSQSTTRMGPDVHHHSQSCDRPRRRSRGQSQGHYRALPEEGYQAQFPTPGPTGYHQQVPFLGPRNNIWRRTSNWAGLCQSWSGDLARAGARPRALPAGAGQHARRGWAEWAHTRAPSRGLKKIGLSGGDAGSTHWWQELVGIQE